MKTNTLKSKSQNKINENVTSNNNTSTSASSIKSNIVDTQDTRDASQSDEIPKSAMDHFIPNEQVSCDEASNQMTSFKHDQCSQTMIDNNEWIDWANMKEGFLDKICDQEKQIMDLQNQVKSLEYLISQIKAPDTHQPEHGVKGTNIQHQSESMNINTKHTISSCYVIGDSHVRRLSEKIKQLVPVSCKIESHFNPGAGFEEVADIQSQMNQVNNMDCVVLMCGTNDICSSSWTSIQSALDKLTTKFNNCKLFCLIGIPLRYDNTRYNFHIHKFNAKLKNYVSSRIGNDKFSYLDPSKFLKYKDYAYDQLHMNRFGKFKISKKIKNILSKKFKFNVLNLEYTSQVNFTQYETVLNTSDNNRLHHVTVPNRRSYSQVVNLPQYSNCNPFSSGQSTPNNYVDNSSHLHVRNANTNNDYYRLTQRINLSTYSNDSTFTECTPIPRIEPGYQRSKNQNFQLQGLIEKI